MLDPIAYLDERFGPLAYLDIVVAAAVAWLRAHCDRKRSSSNVRAIIVDRAS